MGNKKGIWLLISSFCVSALAVSLAVVINAANADAAQTAPTKTTQEPGYRVMRWELLELRQPEEMAKQADIVVLGKVLAIDSPRWNTPDNKRPTKLNLTEHLIYQPMHIRVQQYVKGSGPATITLDLPGGKLGGDVYKNSSYPDFTQGEEVLLMLKQEGGKYSLLGNRLGKYTVANGRVIGNLANAELSDFLARIR